MEGDRVSGVYWLRLGWETKLAAVGEWARANGLNPAEVSASDPFVVAGQEALCRPPTLTVTMRFEIDEYEPKPGDQVTPPEPGDELITVKRTVPLNVEPPPDLFINISDEIQRAAAGDPRVRAWIEERLTREATE